MSGWLEEQRDGRVGRWMSNGGLNGWGVGGGEQVTLGGQALLGEVANPEFHALASLPFPGPPPPGRLLDLTSVRCLSRGPVSKPLP